MVTFEDVQALAVSLPRAEEAVVRGRIKFRVGRIVYLAFSGDETLMGFAFPKDERDALIASEPHKFTMPKQSDQRYNWVVVRLATIDRDEMQEIVLDAWRLMIANAATIEDSTERGHGYERGRERNPEGDLCSAGVALEDERTQRSHDRQLEATMTETPSWQCCYTHRRAVRRCLAGFDTATEAGARRR